MSSEKENAIQPDAPLSRYSVKRLLLQTVAVAIVGLIFAFLANALSPRGLTIQRNYFPSGTTSLNPGLPGTGAATTNATNLTEILVARLKSKNLQMIDSNQVVQLYRDPRYQQETLLFLDARDDDHYVAGHIPAAYQFNHYELDKHIGVITNCLVAEQIVIYCNGGDCEDSEFAAVTLRELGVPNEKMFIYTGGFSEWSTNRLPIEIGVRNSGNVRNPIQ